MKKTMIVAGALLLAFAGAPLAQAEPGVDTIVCQQSALGESPGDIAQQLHEGDPRYSIWDTTQTVWSALQNCDQS